MKFLIVRVHAGLGNRIRALVAGRRVAKKLGRQLAVIWSLDSYHCWCPYDFLFRTPHFFVGDSFAGRSVELYGIGRKPNFIRSSIKDAISIQEENFFWAEGDQDVMWGPHGPYQARNETIQKELLDEFAALEPSHFVSNEVDQFIERDFRQTMIGVHIRREDNTWSNKNCTDEMFVERLNEALFHMPDAGILLATDGAKSEEAIRKRFGWRVTTYPVRSLSRGQAWQAVQDGLITMLLLSRTDLLIRSCSSSFSQCAAWFGNLPSLSVGQPEHNF